MADENQPGSFLGKATLLEWSILKENQPGKPPVSDFHL